MSIQIRTAAHKTRKGRLNSHLTDYKPSFNYPTKKESLRTLFRTPNLETFYPQEVVL